MLESIAWSAFVMGLVSAVSLPLGAATTRFWRPDDRATAILMAYLLLVGAGLRTALRTERPFEKLLAVGLTTILGVQAFIIIGGVIKLVPLTGITLPFVSYGGSSLIATGIAVGMLFAFTRTRPQGEIGDILLARHR